MIILVDGHKSNGKEGTMPPQKNIYDSLVIFGQVVEYPGQLGMRKTLHVKK